jgi:hypothetical protein
MPSTATKKKLKAFQFVDGAPDAINNQGANKENDTEMSKDGAVTEQGAIKPQQTPAKLSRVAAVLSAKNCPPSTPENASRLPLNQLIGNGAFSARAGQIPVQQEEELLWKQATPLNSQHSITPARKSKRPRSSSPPSASAAVRPQPNAFKTPKQDPAAEIWSRYRGDLNNTNSALHASQNGIENLLIQSSPRSSATAGSVGGLRRYNSCGYQWPTSRKKRKVSHPPRDLGIGIVESSEDEAKEEEVKVHKVSKVGLFLEEAGRIRDLERQESMPKENGDEEQSPSISSPLPHPCLLDDQVEADSPLQNRAPLSANGSQEGLNREEPTKGEALGDEVGDALHSSGEFSDLDMDDADLNALLESTAAPNNPTVMAAPELLHQSIHIEAVPSTAATQTKERPSQQPPQAQLDEEFDEFGDDDILSDNAWAQAALLAERHTQVSLDQNSLPVPEIIHVGSSPATTFQHSGVFPLKEPSSDEFGDDIGVDEFAAAEALATQAFSAGTVCL